MMRAYVGITGVIFALIFAAHVARVVAEGTGPLHNPFFILLTVAALALSIWAALLLFRRPR